MIIGYAYLVADLFHIGHLKALQNAKKYCDYLIVGCLSNRACMEKKSKPIISYKERKVILESCKYVNKVIIQKEYSPLNNIKRIKPHILMESDNHPEQPANEYVKSYGGKIIITKYYIPQSSTKIKNKIINIC